MVTRLATRNGVKGYQVTRMPIPVRSLSLDDVPDGELRTGSFRGAFSSNLSGKSGTVSYIFGKQLFATPCLFCKWLINDINLANC